MRSLLLVLLAVSAFAQPKTDAQIAEMKKLSFLVGEWRGEGWIQTGPERREFKGAERIEPKLSGLLLLIEGLHHRKEAGHENEVAHEALAVVSYDPRSQSFRFRAYTATGQTVESDAKVSPKQLEWGFEPTPGMKIQYVIKIDEKGRWVETGDMSREGAPPRRFFEMTLTKAN